MKTKVEKTNTNKWERGQAIILIAFAFVGIVAMVGLVTDVGLLLIEYGKLKRAVDAAAVAAAQEFRPDPDTGTLNLTAMENAALSLLQVNQLNNVRDITVHTCEDTGPERPDLCNPDPIDNPIENRKLVEVTAISDIAFGFLRVLGINSTEVRVTSIGEAATIDLVLIIDTSGSMAYETDSASDPFSAQAGDDPIQCNVDDDCQPLRAVKDIALDFVDSLIYFGYDRVSIIAGTGQASGPTDAVSRDPVEVLPLSFDRNMIFFSIDTLKVYQPRICQETDNDDLGNIPSGECLRFFGGSFDGTMCPAYEYPTDNPDPLVRATANWSSCPSSNIGGTMVRAQNAFSDDGIDDPSDPYDDDDPDRDYDNRRLDSLWVTVSLLGGPANATDPGPGGTFPFGYCPQNTWLDPSVLPDPDPPPCRDAYPSTRHTAGETISWTNPLNGETIDMSLYDADDYARDSADNLAALKTGNGVTIYTIGLGSRITRDSAGEPGVPEAATLLEYIASEAGSTLNPDINHGAYFFAPNNVTLRNIFEIIAQNIATKISQ